MLAFCVLTVLNPSEYNRDKDKKKKIFYANTGDSDTWCLSQVVV